MTKNEIAKKLFKKIDWRLIHVLKTIVSQRDSSIGYESLKSIKERGQRLLEEIVQDKYDSISCGMLVAYREREGNLYYYGLRFEAHSEEIYV